MHLYRETPLQICLPYNHARITKLLSWHQSATTREISVIVISENRGSMIPPAPKQCDMLRKPIVSICATSIRRFIVEFPVVLIPYHVSIHRLAGRVHVNNLNKFRLGDGNNRINRRVGRAANFTDSDPVEQLKFWSWFFGHSADFSGSVNVV